MEDTERKQVIVADAFQAEYIWTRYRAMCGMRVIIDTHVYECHYMMFYTKSLYFVNFFASCKKEWPLQMDLSALPGKEKAFEFIMDFCYQRPVTLTSTNVFIILAAAEFLGCTEVIYISIISKGFHSVVLLRCCL